LKARSVIGLTVALLGLSFIILGLYQFNELFFLRTRISAQDLPLYGQLVASLILLGVLLSVDGVLVASLSSGWALGTLLLANLLYAFSSVQLVALLLAEQTNPALYQQPFFALAASAIFFILGGIIDSLRRG